MPEMSSLFNFFKMVVLPALSSPISDINTAKVKSSVKRKRKVHVQEKNPHFMFFLPILSNNSEETHIELVGLCAE